MSFKCIDIGVKRKLSEVYPNVVFGPLSRALENDAESNVDYNNGGLVIHSDHDDYEIINSRSTNPVASGVNNAPEYGSDRTTKNQVVAFPLIAFDRIKDNIMFGDTSNDPLIRRGWRRDVYTNKELGYDDPTRPRERAFPVEPIYQIDIISNRRVEVDEITRELLMYLYLSPNISVLYSEGTDEEFEELYPLLVIDEDETSDVETFEDKGIIYRKTITTQLKDAKLIFHKRVPLIEQIPLHVETFNDDWLVKEDK